MMKGERTALIAVFVIRTHHTNGAVERSETISVYLRCWIDRDLSEILRFAQNDTRRWLFVILSGFDIRHSSFILRHARHSSDSREARFRARATRDARRRR